MIRCCLPSVINSFNGTLPRCKGKARYAVWFYSAPHEQEYPYEPLPYPMCSRCADVVVRFAALIHCMTERAPWEVHMQAMHAEALNDDIERLRSPAMESARRLGAWKDDQARRFGGPR